MKYRIGQPINVVTLVAIDIAYNPNRGKKKTYGKNI